MRYAALCSFLIVFVPQASSAENYLPLDVGNRWTYVGVNGGFEQTEITGSFERNGATVYSRRYWEGGPNAGLSNYWTSEPGGDVLLWGFYRTVEGFGWYYDPPLRLVDAPLELGKRWSQASRRISIPDGADLGEFTIGFQVHEAATLDLPAGSFFAFGIGQFLPPMPAPQGRGSYGLRGDLLPAPATSQATDWWSEGVGHVQFRTDDLYRLPSFDFPTPILRGSWAAIKQLYR